MDKMPAHAQVIKQEVDRLIKQTGLPQNMRPVLEAALHRTYEYGFAKGAGG